MAEAMAVMKVAGPFIAPIISAVAAKASPYFGGDVTAEKLDNLRTTILPQIQLIIDAAGDAGKEVAGLGPWLSKLRAAALEADDVVDEWEYRCLKFQANPHAPVLRHVINCYKTVKELAAPAFFKTKLMKRVEELEKVASEAGRFMELLGLHRDSQTNPNADYGRDTSVPSPPPIVVGRERECEHWVHVLTMPTDEEAKASTQRWRAPVHAIWGIGGAGKTTLAQSVFNHPRIKEQFRDMRIWVHLPRKLDVAQVTRDMIEFITKGECSRMETLAALQAKLREIIEKSQNKILLVLDDLWADKPEEDRIQLETLLQPLNEAECVGSMVLMTTRMEGAAAMLGAINIVPINELDDDKCRSIILHYAGKGIDELDAEKTWALSMIVPKLKCSPLAARLVGNRLCFDDDWSVVARGAMLEGTKNALLWSFKRLPSRLRSCFAFCSLFPKGCVFSVNDLFLFWGTRCSVDKLVCFWIAQGFVEEPTEAEKDLTIEEKGKRCFNELRFFSFFQQHPHLEGAYVMHDLLHDLAEDVSQGHCFRIDDNMATTDIPSTVIHLSIAVSRLAVPIPDLMKLVNLRTFLILDISDDNFADVIKHCEEMFKKLAKLRLLHLGWNHSLKWLKYISIGELKHLRYLQGATARELPMSLGTRYHLNYIHLIGEFEFEPDYVHIAPKSLNNLVKLRHVRPDWVCSKIDDFGKLTSLQELRVYDADRTKKYGLQQLEKMHQIGGRLKIEGLEFVEDKAGATIAMLKEKRHLGELVLEWDRAGDVNPDTVLAVLEGLEPHPNLKTLEILGYSGANPPSWMGVVNNQHFLPNLTSLTLGDCPNLTVVPNLPCHRLRELIVWVCPKLIQLHPFPCSLEVLVMSRWPGTESFLSGAVASYNKREQPQQQHPLSTGSSSALRYLVIQDDCVLEENTLNEFLLSNKFPSLSEVRFKSLPSVTSLLMGPHLTALEDLSIVGLENLKSIKGIGSLKSLKQLTVTGCPDLTTNAGAGGEIDNGDCVPSFLEVDEPLLLPALLQEQCLNSLVELKIMGCSQDVPFSAEQECIFLHLTSLKSLSFDWCENLPSLPRTLVKLPSIEELKIMWCDKIESLPKLPSSLQSLRIWGCHPQLEANYAEGGLLRHEIHHIPFIHIGGAD